MSWFYPELDNLRLPQLVRGDQIREPSFGDAVVDTYIWGVGVPKGTNYPILSRCRALAQKSITWIVAAVDALDPPVMDEKAERCVQLIR